MKLFDALLPLPRIAVALERIATALERVAPPPLPDDELPPLMAQPLSWQQLMQQESLADARREMKMPK